RLGKELKEIKDLTFGGTGRIRYEMDIKKEVGRMLLMREETNLTGTILKMSSLVDRIVRSKYPSHRVIHKTLRGINIKGRKFIILSRLILASRPNLVISDSSDVEDIVLKSEIELLLPYAQELLLTLSDDY
ncbi:unnamed protein product, partial [marine sediment metagenome]